jgi:CheY-like chemotaxis protein
MDPLRVLVVEDDHDTADALVELLESMGHEARAAYDGHTAVQVARSYLPAVLVCDLTLPGLDGYQIARELRADPLTAKLRMVALTGFSQKEVGAKLREAGFDAHLVKPISVETLEDAVQG